MSTLDGTIKFLSLTKNNLEAQIIDNSSDLRLVQKHSSAETSDIEAQYAPEEEYIENQIASLDKTQQRSEYQDLLTEKHEIQTKKDEAIEQVELKTSDKEADVQLENETLEVQLEDVKAQEESFKEMRKEKVENDNDYFQ